MSVGSVRQDRHLWNSRRTAVPYAQYVLNILPKRINCQVVYQPCLQPVGAPLPSRGAQNAHLIMAASCWRLARGRMGLP